MNIRKLLTRLVSLALIAVFLPTVAMADTWYLEDGSITVSATDSGQNVSQGGVTKEDSAPVIRNRDSSASTTNNVTIRADTGATANVTLEDTNIDTTGGAGPKGAGDAAVRTEGAGNVNLNVELDNTLQSGNTHAGVEKGNGGNLTIGSESGSGQLVAVGADGYQLAGAGFGADGQIAAVALFHTGVCVSALQGVVQFNVQVDVAGALGSHRRVACTLRPCAAGGVDVGVLQGHVGRRPCVRPDGDIVGGGSGRIPVPDDGGGILFGHAALADVLAAIGGGDGDAAVLQVPGIRHRDGGQEDRDQSQRNEPGQKLSDVHSVASLQREGFVVYKPIITWIGRKCKRINGLISGASAGFPVAKGSHL